MRRGGLARLIAGPGLAALAAAGCSSSGAWEPPSSPTLSARQPLVTPDSRSFPVHPASFRLQPGASKASGAATAGVAPVAAQAFGLDDLVRLAVERNPRVARATIAIDAAQGRYIQAGLYPNPELAFRWDEIGDRSSPDRLGIMSPQATQTIVTGRKLSLAQAVAAREVDQATLDMLAERFAVIGSVRAAFYDAYALQQRHSILTDLVRLAEQAVEQSKALVEAQRAARLDLVQLEVELERFRAEARAVERELPATYQRMAAVTGDLRLQVERLVGPFDAPPAYDMEVVREAVLSYHPLARAAQVRVDRARAAIRQAEAQPIPNLTVTGGYVRQFENRSHDAMFGLSAPIPVWNRNQGNIRAATAELGMSIQNVGLVANELAERLAVAFRSYTAARERAERYRTRVIPKAEETYKLSLEAFKGGQFEYLRVLQAQRAVSEARLELNRSLGEAWRAAGEISGLLLEEVWPGPQKAADPAPGVPEGPP